MLGKQLKGRNLWRMAPLIALGTATLLLIMAVAIALYSEQSYERQQEQGVAVQAQILAASVSAALAFDDAKAVQSYVDAMRANPEIRAVAVYDADGLRVAGFAIPGGPPLPTVAEMPGTYVSNDRLVVVRPVVQGDLLLGTVYLRTLSEPWVNRLNRYAGLALLVTMASLIIAVLAAAQSALTRANTALERQARDLAEAYASLQVQIVEREKAEDALRQSQKMEAIGQLSGGIAHDFNNLLTIVRGNLQLLQRRVKEGKTDVASYIELAMDGLTRAASVTQRILAFSRRQPLSPEPVDLSRLVESMSELLPHSVGAQIAVEKHLDAGWWTLCDANQMENVLLNLVINARDAMPDGGRLIIETANMRVESPRMGFEDLEPGDYVKLSVTDTGIGMPDDVRRRAIDPFFTTKPPGQGTGLGLSMIFGYIKQSKGGLQIESAPGQGTTVTILMPRYEGDGDVAPHVQMQAAAPAAEAAHEPSDVEAPAVLIVEDEALVRMLAAETIRDEGYMVTEEGDGRAALDILESDARIDLLISDIKLPGLGGFQLAEAGLARRPGLKVLLVTGYTQDQLPQSLAAAGVRILYKPYNVADLAAIAKEMIERTG